MITNCDDDPCTFSLLRGVSLEIGLTARARSDGGYQNTFNTDESYVVSLCKSVNFLSRETDCPSDARHGRKTLSVFDVASSRWTELEILGGGFSNRCAF
jgi:hypothetical protein